MTNYKSNFMQTEEELEEQRKELMIEMNQLNNEMRKDRNKKILIITSIILVAVVIIKLFFGVIEIPNIFGYPTNRTRFYKVSINGELTNTHSNIKHSIPIVPHLIHINSYTMGNSDVRDDLVNNQFDVSELEKIIINIDSYSCFSKENKYQVECKNIDQNMKKNNDEKYKQMIITRTSNPYEEVYNGELINDITKFVNKKGVYCIQIYSKHSLITTEIEFYLIN